MSTVVVSTKASLPVVAALRAAREQLDTAKTPESVQGVRDKLAVFRAACAAAFRAPDVDPETVAVAKREAEELALDATVKLGSMVPYEGAQGQRTDLVPSASTTVVEVAKRCGVAGSTLRRYRDLAAAFAHDAVGFMSLAREAIFSGREVPMGKLIALCPKPKPQKAWVDRPPTNWRGHPAPAPARKPAPTSPTRAQQDAKELANSVMGTLARGLDDPRKEPNREEFAPRVASCAVECGRHASAVEAAARFLQVIEVEVNTPDLDAAVALARKLGGSAVLAETVRVLREIESGDRAATAAEQIRIDQIHRGAAATRKTVLR